MMFFPPLQLHGTGTALGDPIEISAMFGALLSEKTDGRRQALCLGANKTAMGHSEPSSGMAGLLSSLLLLSRGVAVPILHLRSVNPEIMNSFARRPGAARIPRGTAPSPLASLTNMVATSSFAWHGTNAEVIFSAGEVAALPKTLGRGPFFPQRFSMVGRVNPLYRDVKARDGIITVAAQLANSSVAADLRDCAVGGKIIYPCAALLELSSAVARSVLVDGRPDPGQSLVLNRVSQGLPLTLTQFDSPAPEISVTILSAHGALEVASSRHSTEARSFFSADVAGVGVLPVASLGRPLDVPWASLGLVWGNRRSAGFFTPPTVLEAALSLTLPPTGNQGQSFARTVASMASFFAPFPIVEGTVSTLAELVSAPSFDGASGSCRLVGDLGEWGATHASQLMWKPATLLRIDEPGFAVASSLAQHELQNLSYLSPPLSDSLLASLNSRITSAVRKLIGCEILDDEPLMEAGLDSILSVQLIRTLEAELEVRLPATLTFDCPTLASLCDYVASALAEKQGGASREVRPAAAPPSALSAAGFRYPRQSSTIISLQAYSRCVAGHALADPASVDRITIVRSHWDVFAIGNYLRNPALDGLSTPFMGVVPDVETFDAAFLISSNEAIMMDPQQRLLLHHAYESLQSPLEVDRRRSTGVYVGISNLDYASVAALLPPSSYAASGIALSVACGRISYFFGLNGPSASVDTGAPLVLNSSFNAA